MSNYRRAHRLQNANAPSRIASVAAEVFAHNPALVSEITATAYRLPEGQPPCAPASAEPPTYYRLAFATFRRSQTVTAQRPDGATAGAWRVAYDSPQDAALTEFMRGVSFNKIPPAQFVELGRILESCEVQP